MQISGNNILTGKRTYFDRSKFEEWRRLYNESRSDDLDKIQRIATRFVDLYNDGFAHLAEFESADKLIESIDPSATLWDFLW
jgi:hypothetical protein